jgi:GntR family transcriptional regulator
MTRRLVDRNSSVPYYEQLREIITSGIDDGDWPPGKLIPSEAELISTYQISRTVIRKALDLLSAEGRVRRIRGKGTLVMEASVWDVSPELSGPYQALAGSYRVHTVIENRVVETDDRLRARLGVKTETPILHVVVVSDRLDRSGTAATLSSFDIAGDASAALDRLLQRGETPRFRLGGPPIPVQLSTQFGVRLSHSPTTLSVNICNKSESALLGFVPGSGVFCFEWVSHDSSGRAVITGRSLTGDEPHLRFIVRHDPGPDSRSVDPT